LADKLDFQFENFNQFGFRQTFIARLNAFAILPCPVDSAFQPFEDFVGLGFVLEGIDRNLAAV